MLRIAAFCVLLLPPLAIAADAIAPTVQFERGALIRC